MKNFFLLQALWLSLNGTAQQNFPSDWLGNWKGELQWYKTGEREPRKVAMELRINRGDSINTWSWHIIYGTENPDSRPYKLVLRDSAKMHWVIDENNGIVLDQYWVANRFCGAFTVMGNTIVNQYWMEGDQLLVEFLSIGSKPVATTGNGTEASPAVDSYRVGGYQKAVLRRVK